jgi:hypothetical protein
MSSIQQTIFCLKCEIEREPFMPGGIDDRCPNCGYKEGCCGDSEGQNDWSRRNTE